MRHLIIYICVLLFPLVAQAQKNPKFFKKARAIQLTIFAYDHLGNMEQGQGYFLNERGDILTEYSLLKNAVKLKAVDTEGQEHKLSRVKGANSLYNIVKLSPEPPVLGHTMAEPSKSPKSKSKPKTQNSTTPTMPILRDGLTEGTIVYVMPLSSTDKKALCKADTISKVETFEDGHNYYTLSGAMDERLAGAPVFTTDGQLIGSVQLATGDKQHGYIIAASFGEKLSVTAVDANNYNYRSLAIPTALPEDEQQAVTFLYIVNKEDTMCYRANVEDFVRLFPESSTGYVQLAEFEARQGNYKRAEQVYTAALQHVKEHLDEVHHSFAKLLYQSGLLAEPVSEGWDLAKALTEAQAANVANPMPLYTGLEGMILYAQKNYADAFNKFMAMGETNMRSAEYFLYAAQCKVMMEAPKEEILAVQDSALACYTKPYPAEAANVLYLRSRTLADLERYREAVADLNEYEHLQSGRVTAAFYYEREQLELLSRMFMQALNDIDRCVTMEPEEPLYRAEQAVVNYRVGQLDEALVAAEEAVRLDDTFADAHRLLGICFSDKGKKAEARKHLQRAIELGDEMAKSVLEKIN